jgi:hypothetical protein
MTVYMDVAQAVLECYRDALEADTFPSTPATICLRHGDQVTPSLGTQSDECCSGIAWVRVQDVSPLRAREDVSARCVSSERVVTLELGSAHCLPFGTTEAPPTCDQWTDVALLGDAYHGAMEEAVCCAYGDLLADFRVERVTVGEYLPTGPDGNCVGGTMQVIIETNCGCTRG